jgi:hypothetical protein
MGERYVELQRLKQKAPVFLGPDGKIVEPGAPPPYLSALEQDSDGENEYFLPCILCDKEYRHMKNVTRHLTICKRLF